MAELYSERCTACRRDSPHVTDEEIAVLHPSVIEWALIDESGIPKLDRQFKFRNFVQALEFTNALGELAESEGHHPRLTTEWGRVSVTWWTHKSATCTATTSSWRRRRTRYTPSTRRRK